MYIGKICVMRMFMSCNIFVSMQRGLNPSAFRYTGFHLRYYCGLAYIFPEFVFHLLISINNKVLNTTLCVMKSQFYRTATHNTFLIYGINKSISHWNVGHVRSTYGQLFNLIWYSKNKIVCTPSSKLFLQNVCFIINGFNIVLYNVDILWCNLDNGVCF